MTRCGYVAIIGRPNVGKSTLLNCSLNKKVSITSPKPQTTRWQVMGIKTEYQAQIVYIDTPGLHQDEKRAINRYMNRMASAVIPDADVIVFVIDAQGWQKEDELVLERLKQARAPIILAINKIDTLKDKSVLLPLIDKVKAKFSFTHIVPISAQKKENIALLGEKVIDLLPENPYFFPEDQVTDKGERFQVAEIIREKLIRLTEQELPYTTTIEIEQYKTAEKLIEISAIIWVEREGQKAIVIGKKGERLKKIGTLARKEMEALLKQKVFLRLWVKVKEHWTDDEKALKSLGYE